ncbi:MAG TPA: preprotein translocase subunit SecE [Petrotogaceae bacterium]|jgi:preprotein translocase subunit SecE|nr:preprotein translocase subunit SecE [Petrotogaceae bacterium]HQF33030.1 preprotein translocase subunit SecE [Petrotogaceae bacterium]HQH32243.1 preprotein translocase subunit SecE [Petrotogaceae bacterium]HQI78059.1 preprotein translocase subunit SecE [Petrotogaceae bacterium]
MSKFWVFLSQVWQEAKKVTWPSKKELLNSTVIVLAILLFFAVYLFAVDLGLMTFFKNLIYPITFGG